MSSEISLGRVAGPFNVSPFPDGFLVSPLNTVAKRDSNERRVIVDLRWPCGSSVNDGISLGSFLGELLELSYPTTDAIVSAIISFSQGCILYKQDPRKAYQQFPVEPHDYHSVGYTWNSQFYFDTVSTIGLRLAAMACQRSTLAVTWIFNLGLPVQCDNEVAVTALNSGQRRNAFLNPCLHKVCFLVAKHNFEIRAVHLSGVLNGEAEVLLCWNMPLHVRKRFLQCVTRDASLKFQCHLASSS